MSSFSSEERAAPFTLEYRVFISEWRGPGARSPIHSRLSGRAGGRVPFLRAGERAGGVTSEGLHPSAHRERSLHTFELGPRGKGNH